MAFVKLDQGMLDSTLWIDREAREVFITALLMARPYEVKEDTPTYPVDSLDETDFLVPPGWYGYVEAAGPGIARRAGLDLNHGLSALVRLGNTEDESRSPDFGGRRMVRVDGGYLILNYDKYRQKDHSAAERMRRHRARKKDSVTPSRYAKTRHVTQAEAEVQAEEEEDSEEEVSIPTGSHPDKSGKTPRYGSPIHDLAEHIYSKYPVKKGKQAATKAIAKALMERDCYQEMLAAVTAFTQAESPKPHASTYFHQRRWEDEDNGKDYEGGEFPPPKRNGNPNQVSRHIDMRQDKVGDFS